MVGIALAGSGPPMGLGTGGTGFLTAKGSPSSYGSAGVCAEITTNILFFDRTHPTTETWFYRLDMPEGYKNFSKTKPMKLEHFAPTVEWWDNREEITIDGFDKAKKYTVEELKARSYNIDLCGYPHEEEEILPPKELIQQYQEKRASLNADIDRILAQITDILGIDITEEGDE